MHSEMEDTQGTRARRVPLHVEIYTRMLLWSSETEWRSGLQEGVLHVGRDVSTGPGDGMSSFIFRSAPGEGQTVDRLVVRGCRST